MTTKWGEMDRYPEVGALANVPQVPAPDNILNMSNRIEADGSQTRQLGGIWAPLMCSFLPANRRGDAR